MYEIKRIDKKSLARIVSLIYGLVGFFVAIGVAILTLVSVVSKNDFDGSVMMVTLFNLGVGLLLGVVAAIVTAMTGWLIGYITGVIYNLFAKKVGGIKIELAKIEDEIIKKEVA